MRLLFDQNLSFKLVRLRADVYPDSAHVRTLGLVEAEDFVIWNYAEEHGFVIVSKDSDFRGLSLLRDHPPKTVLLRVGNAPTPTIVREHRPTLRRFCEDPDTALLALA